MTPLFMLILLASAFAGQCAGAETLYLPTGLETIAQEAFLGDVSIETVVLADGVQSIGSKAFAQSGLLSIEMTDSVEYIAPDAFEGCEGMEVSCPASNAYVIGYCEKYDIAYSFRESDPGFFGTVDLGNGCCSIVSYSGEESVLVVPDEIGGLRVTAIGDTAFREKQSLKTVYLPEGLLEIGEESFRNCVHLEKVYFTPDIVSIGSSAFKKDYYFDGQPEIRYYCRADWPLAQRLFTLDGGVGIGFGGEYLFFSPSMPEYGLVKRSRNGEDYLEIRMCDMSDSILQTPAEIDGLPVKSIESLWPASDCLTCVVISEGVTALSGLANCYELQFVSLPDSLKTLGPCCFQDCGKLGTVALPAGLQEIENSAFSGCSALESLVIPEGVSSIGDGSEPGVVSSVFSGCGNLKILSIPESVSSIAGSADDVFGWGVQPTIYCEQYSYAASWADLYSVPFVYADSDDTEQWVVLPEELTLYEDMKIRLRPESFIRESWAEQLGGLLWTSSCPEIVSVDENGVIEAKGLGVSTVTAYYDMSDCLDSIKVTVIRPLSSFELSHTNLEMRVGETLSLEICDILPDGALTGAFAWESSDPVIAAVDQEGTITARAVGETVITVRSSNGIGRRCTVNIRKPE